MDKIVCIGKNYLEHVKELGGVSGSKPVLFLKPPSVLREVKSNGDKIELSLPPNIKALHHECELVLQIKTGGYCLTEAQARDSIKAVTVGLDMTQREVQSQLKKAGHPWTLSKVFLNSAVIGPLVDVKSFPSFLETEFSISIQGEKRQKATAKEMIFSPFECIKYISEQFPLCPGDLIFTGTPAGVANVVDGTTAQLSFGPIQYQVRWNSFHE